jgi:hypothetical protein
LLVLWSSGIVDSEVQGVSHDHRELSRVGGQADSAKEAAAGETSNCRSCSMMYSTYSDEPELMVRGA